MSGGQISIGSLQLNAEPTVMDGAWFRRSERDHVNGTATVYEMSGPHGMYTEIHYVQLENGERWVTRGEAYSGPKWIWAQTNDRLRMSVTTKKNIPTFDLALPTPGSRSKEAYTISYTNVADLQRVLPNFEQLLKSHGVKDIGPRMNLYGDISSRKKYLAASMETMDCLAPVVAFCFTRILSLLQTYEDLHASGEVGDEFTHMLDDASAKRRKGGIDELTQLVADGESAYVEFKSTIWFDINQARYNKEYTPKKEPYIQDNIIKTVAGFLNSEGGCLLIGVSDRGESYGLEADLGLIKRGDLDGLENEMTQMLMDALSTNIIATNVRTTFPKFQGKTIAKLDVKAANSPVFSKTSKDSEAFYVRIGNLTQLMSVQSALNYISHHKWTSD